MIILLCFKIFNFELFGHFWLISQSQFSIFGILGVKISKNEKFHKIWLNVSGKQKNDILRNFSVFEFLTPKSQKNEN